jgi:hypothetical protein
MTKWEYHFERVHSDSFGQYEESTISKTNNLGMLGWELVSILAEQKGNSWGSNSIYNTLIFKRKKE